MTVHLASRGARSFVGCLTVFLCLVGVARGASGEPPAPLPPAAAAAFAAVRPDPPPAGLIRDSHYVISNEDQPQAFRGAIAGRGGVYIGVGSEQNYVLAAWARPEVLALFDFDQVIVDLHRAYGAFFQAARDGAELIELWRPQNEARALSLLGAAYPDPQRLRGVVRAYKIGRAAIPARLEKLRRLLGAAGAPSFLDDPAQYAYLAGLWRSGRVLPVRGDLTATQALRDVGDAARRAGLPVRVLYLSNAERYFPYGPDFKKSVAALPFDDQSLVLRTGARQIGRYVYMVQGGRDFQAWLRRPSLQTVSQLTRLRDLAPAGEAAVIRRLPGRSEDTTPIPPLRVTPAPAAAHGRRASPANQRAGTAPGPGAHRVAP